MKKRFTIFVFFVLFLLIASQLMWLNQVLERDKNQFEDELRKTITTIIKYQLTKQTFNLLAINPQSSSITIERLEQDAVPNNAKSYGNYDENNEKNISISNFLEEAMTEVLLEKESLNLLAVDSLFQNNFQYASELLAYSFKTEKNNKTTDSLYFGNNAVKQLNDTTKGVFINIPLGTSETHLFVSHFVFEPSAITRRLVRLAAMSAVAVIAVALILFVLSFQLQQQIYRLQSHEKNVRSIIHDLKSPLNYLYSMLDFFELGETNQLKNEQLAIGKSRIKRLSDNVERMLSEIIINENKSVHLQREHYDLEKHCREIAEDLQIIYKEKCITVTYAIEPDAQTIYVDAFYFDSCLRNLFDNAIKYSGESPVISVMARKEKNEVQIRISDNGTGISKKERRFIFKPFFRSIRHSSIQGHGLGLQSVQLIIKALSGKVTLDSILGKGSTFTIHIPDK